MAKRIIRPNYYAYLARVQDEQAVDQFCNNLPENFLAILVSNNTNYAGLVLPVETHGPTALLDDPAFTHDEILDHPLTRESNTRIGALTDSYKAYMGSLLTEQVREVS